MMEIQTVLIFSAACFALCMTPGPDMILVAARSAAQGRMAGFITQFGVTAGSMFHAVIMALGLSQLFLTVPYAYDMVRYLGAAYLLYLAWQSLTASGGGSSEESPTGDLTLPIIFKQGFFSNLLNPKVALFYLALFPQFLNHDGGPIALQIMVLATILQVIDFAVHAVVIWLAGGVKSLSSNGRNYAKWSKYFLGLVFGGLAARLIFYGER